MNTSFDFGAEAGQIVYVKPVPVADLPQDIQDKAGDLETLFAVHDANGAQIALVANRPLAYELARQNDMMPVALH